MGYNRLLIHRVDLFHLQKKEQSHSYGIPNSESYEYNETPDKTDVHCYMTRKTASVQQTEPGQVVLETYLVHFSINEDVRQNDKIVFNDVTYRIENPIPVRSHHIEATAVRED